MASPEEITTLADLYAAREATARSLKASHPGLAKPSLGLWRQWHTNPEIHRILREISRTLYARVADDAPEQVVEADLDDAINEALDGGRHSYEDFDLPTDQHYERSLVGPGRPTKVFEIDDYAAIDNPEQLIEHLRTDLRVLDTILEAAVEAQVPAAAAAGNTKVAELRSIENAIVRREYRIWTDSIARYTARGLNVNDAAEQSMVDTIGLVGREEAAGDFIRLGGSLACARELAGAEDRGRLGFWDQPTNPDAAKMLDEFYRFAFQIGEDHGFPVASFDRNKLLIEMYTNRLSMLPPNRAVHEYHQTLKEIAEGPATEAGLIVQAAPYTDAFEALLRDDMAAQAYESLCEKIIELRIVDDADGDLVTLDFRLSMMEEAGLIYDARQLRIKEGKLDPASYQITYDEPAAVLEFDSVFGVPDSLEELDQLEEIDLPPLNVLSVDIPPLDSDELDGPDTPEDPEDPDLPGDPDGPTPPLDRPQGPPPLPGGPGSAPDPRGPNRQRKESFHDEQVERRRREEQDGRDDTTSRDRRVRTPHQIPEPFADIGPDADTSDSTVRRRRPTERPALPTRDASEGPAQRGSRSHGLPEMGL